MRVSAQQFRDQMVKPKNKYGAKKFELDGVVFDSTGEARYWSVLRLREKAGEIYGLERQKRYDLTSHGVFICYIKPDYTYYDNKEKRQRIQDFKGVITPSFRIKAKLFKAQYGVEIEVVKG